MKSNPAVVLATTLAGLLLTASPNSAQTDEELARMSLEELMNIQVTTVSRSAELARLTPAAVFVITADDIRRSGATSLVEALRLAPGMQVARMDAGKWSIGVRGFADRLSRSMLVLIDGRAVYSPLFAGTYWETQDLVLEDIERIEVIRGPGGTLWGSNAVNGIVSIVTKSARDTQGLLVTGAAGTENRAQGSVRYGDMIGERTFLRGYATGFDAESQYHTGTLEYDGWRMAQAGARLDSELSGGQHLTFHGGIYTARLGEHVRETSLAPPYLGVRAAEVPLAGGNLLGRWSRPLGRDADFELQTYYEHSDREEYPVSETRQTFDADLQVRHTAWARHLVIWGLGYRLTSGDMTTAPTSSLPSGTESLFSGFAQDEFLLADERLRVTLGMKLEHNAYSGLELQPSARAVWLASPTNTLWAAVTRAIRRPSRVERQYETTSIVDPTAPAFVHLLPNPDFLPEKLLAYEAGYRVSPGPRAYFTVAAFYNRWNDLLTTELIGTFQEPTGETIYPVQLRNGLDGNSFGVELTADVRPRGWWRASGHYAFLRVRMTPKPGATDLTQESRYEKGSPRHQVRLANSFDLPGPVSLDWSFRYVSELPDVLIPSYTTSDVRLAWQAADELELEIVGRNLHDDHHAEWPGENGGANVEIQRSVYIGFIWRR